MKLDFKSFAFGYSLKNGSNTPAWETALGQGKGYKIKEDNSMNDLIKGMVYKAVPSKFISFNKGKGGNEVKGDSDDSGLVIAAVFDKVYVNAELINGGKFVLLISKDDAPSHPNRLKLKYGPSNKFECNDESLTNRNFIERVHSQFKLSQDACWFVFDISIIEQDTLILKSVIVNPKGSEVYEDTKAHHEAWDKAVMDNFNEADEQVEVDCNSKIDELMKKENREFAFACIDLMKENNLLTEKNLKVLSSKNQCASLFKHNNFHGIFFKLNSDLSSEAEINEQKKSQDGIPRYYSDNYEFNNENYAVSSQWKPIKEDNDSRMSFVNWIIGQLQKVNYKTGYTNALARNRIFFGAPGTGKSYIVDIERKKLLGNDADENFERVTFHPDYSYANFVGTYKPVPTKDDDGKDAVTYEYVPGPFMRVYVDALKSGKTSNPKPYLLIIEEINRANVAAVFGDVFQLLDRVNNISEYPIMPSQDIKEYLAKPDVLGGNPDDYNIIKIPDNMFIWATMNSADQGVFPMDTAFKRRWDFLYIDIDDAARKMSDSIKNKKYHLGKDSYARDVAWNDLRSAINSALFSEPYNINEDKLLGLYFIANEILDGGDDKKFQEVFKNKVLMYLFDDAVKQKRKMFFEKCNKGNGVRYSDICKQFDEKGVFIFPEEISKKFTEKATPDEILGANEE